MDSKHRPTKQLVTLASVQPARALAASLAHDRRTGPAQRAAPAMRRWRRAGRYRVAG